MLNNLLSMSALNLFKAATQFGISALVALYVLPGEYGLVTFSLPIIQFIALFTDMGLASALIREPSLSEADAGGAMSFSLAVGAAAAALLAALAWPIERWSALPGLGPVLAALALAVFLAIVAGVPRALLERALRYRRVAVIEGAATVLAATTCITAVVAGAGIWGLVGFHIVLQGARAAGFLLATRGLMRLHARWRSVGGLLSFGGWVLATNVINFFGRNAQNILIGAWLGAAAVGLYGLAYQFMILPLMALAWPAGGVLMATLSRAAEPTAVAGTLHDGRFARPVLAISTVTAALAFPAMGFVAFGLAWPARALLSAHWGPLVPLLRVLAPLGAVQALASYNGAVLIARGHARAQFTVNAASTAALLVGFVAALPFGLAAFAGAYLGVGLLVAAGQIAAKLWAAELPAGRYARALLPGLLATALGGAAALLAGPAPAGWPAWAGMTAAYAAGALAGLALLRGALLRAVRGLTAGGRSRAGVAEATADAEPLHTTGGPAAPTVA